MSLPWFQASTIEFLLWWQAQVYTDDAPCHPTMAIMAYQAITAGGIQSQWGRVKFRDHCHLTERQARTIMQTACTRQGGSARTTNVTPASHSDVEPVPDAYTKRTTNVTPSPTESRGKQAKMYTADGTAGTTNVTPASMRRPSRARLKIESEILDPDREVEREGDAGSEEKDLKKEDLNTGAEAPMTVADPWEKLSKELKPGERSHLPAIQQFHGELVKKGMRAKALDLKQCRTVIAALAMYPIEDLLLAVQGIQWDEYSKGKRRCLEVGWILNPERIAGWIELGVEGPPPGHPMSKRNLNGAKQDGIDTYRAIMFNLPAGVEHLASAATTMGTEGGAALGNRPVRDMRGIPPIRKL